MIAQAHIPKGLEGGGHAAAGGAELGQAGFVVEEGGFQPQPDGVALGGVLLGGGAGPFGQGLGPAGGGAGIEHQPAQRQPHRPVVAVAVHHGRHADRTAAARAGAHIKGVEVGAIAGAIGEQRQLGQQRGGGGIPLAGQGFAGGQDRLQLRVAAVGRQQALLQVEGPAGHGADRVAGAGGDLRRQVEHRRQLAPGDGAIGQGLDQRFLVAGFDGAPAHHIQPRHQPRLFEVEGVPQDQQVVAHGGIKDAHGLVGLLQLVVGLADLQLQLA